MTQCIGNIRGKQCPSNAGETTLFCDSHHQETYKAYHQYKQSTNEFVKHYETFEQCQTSFDTDELRSLYNKSMRVYTQREDFRNRYVHTSCHDEGHAHQIEVYRDLTRHFDRCLTWEYSKLENERRHPRGKDALKKHREHLERCEARKQSLLQNDIILKNKWNQIKSVNVIKQQLADNRAQKQNEVETMKTLETLVSNNIKEVKENLTLRSIQHKLEKTDWIQSMVQIMFNCLLQNNPAIDTSNVVELNEALINDPSLTCSLIKGFCAFFFEQSIVHYTPFFRGLLYTVYRLTAESLLENNQMSKLSEIIRLRFETALYQTNKEEKQMILGRLTEMKQQMRRKGYIRYA